MDEDSLITLIFAALGVIIIISSLGFLIPSNGVTGFSISSVSGSNTPLSLFLLVGLIISGMVGLTFRKSKRSIATTIPVYVKQARRAGLSSQQIRNNLKDAGWTRDEIRNHL